MRLERVLGDDSVFILPCKILIAFGDDPSFVLLTMDAKSTSVSVLQRSQKEKTGMLTVCGIE